MIMKSNMVVFKNLVEYIFNTVSVYIDPLSIHIRLEKLIGFET